MPFVWEAVPRTRDFCREAREAGVPPVEFYLRRKASYLARIKAMQPEERRAELIAALRAWRQPVTRSLIWPQMHAVLDELVAEGRVEAYTAYRLVGEE